MIVIGAHKAAAPVVPDGLWRSYQSLSARTSKNCWETRVLAGNMAIAGNQRDRKRWVLWPPSSEYYGLQTPISDLTPPPPRRARLLRALQTLCCDKSTILAVVDAGVLGESWRVWCGGTLMRPDEMIFLYVLFFREGAV